MHGAVEISRFGEIARGAEQDRGVAVMAAAVKAAGNRGTPFQVGVLLHRQRIHVGAQSDASGARALAFEHADHAGTAEPAVYLDAPLREFLGDNSRGPHLLESDLGMGVQVPADGGEFVGKGVDARDIGHLDFPMGRNVCLAAAVLRHSAVAARRRSEIQVGDRGLLLRRRHRAKRRHGRGFRRSTSRKSGRGAHKAARFRSPRR
jgi:hypothetical protein